jgi:integrase
VFLVKTVTKKINGGGKASRECPNCHSKETVKNASRNIKQGRIQRFLCKKCGHRFSEASTLSRILRSNNGCQVCVSSQRSKNLTETNPQKIGLAGATVNPDVLGKIVQYIAWMEGQRYSKATIKLNASCLRALLANGANLFEPENVKAVIAKTKSWGESRKRNIINAYSLLLKINETQWEKPKCHVERKFPFIPKEEEIDALIAGCGKKTSTFLQLLKETAMRCGEAKRLEWSDVDFERRIVRLNLPEKHSNPRIWRISQKLTAMLNALPRKNERIFGNGPITSIKMTFMRSRKRLAHKLQNPQLQKISFHTLRHWKATMLYRETRDIHYVQRFLGHKSIVNTEIYINIADTIFESKSDEFTVKVVEKPEEIKRLLEAGFENVCQKDNLIFLRKRK